MNQKFEHKIVKVKVDFNPNAIQEAISPLEKDGWEFIQVMRVIPFSGFLTSQNAPYVIYEIIFKRPFEK